MRTIQHSLLAPFVVLTSRNMNSDLICAVSDDTMRSMTQHSKYSEHKMFTDNLAALSSVQFMHLVVYTAIALGWE